MRTCQLSHAVRHTCNGPIFVPAAHSLHAILAWRQLCASQWPAHSLTQQGRMCCDPPMQAQCHLWLPCGGGTDRARSSQQRIDSARRAPKRRGLLLPHSGIAGWTTVHRQRKGRVSACAGTKATTADQKEGFPFPANERGMTTTDATLRVPGHPRVFAIGDTAAALASVPDEQKAGFAPTAQVRSTAQPTAPHRRSRAFYAPRWPAWCS